MRFEPGKGSTLLWAGRSYREVRPESMTSVEAFFQTRKWNCFPFRYK